jgi:L,D-transpeptidase catalytic domain
MAKLWGGVAAALLVASIMGAPALAQGAAQSEPLDLASQQDKLKPGEWVWAPQLAPDGPMLVYVNLNRQIATVFRNGVRIGVSTISSGKPGHNTPDGVFTILQKDADHHSSTYNDAPMPYTERLTWQGVALHAGGLPGYPSSHGCVHLPLAFAKKLFGIESLGGTVVITGGYGDPVRAPLAGLFEPATAGAAPPPPLPSDEQFSWNPTAPSSGPVSIILSAADQQVVVLRNGVEIGRSRADVPQTAATKVMTYAGGKNNEWITVGVNGPAAALADTADTTEFAQLKFPAAFSSKMRSVIAPGTTLVVTPNAVTPASTGTQTVVMDAHDEPTEEGR